MLNHTNNRAQRGKATKKNLGWPSAPVRRTRVGIAQSAIAVSDIKMEKSA